MQPYANLPRLYFYTKPDGLDTKADWYLDFTYPVEQERGLDFQEDLFTPFELSYRLTKGQTIHLVVSTEKKSPVNADDLVASERQRRKEFERVHDTWRQPLVIAANSFVARRGKEEPDGAGRLSVVHGLGPRHDDCVAGAHADVRTVRCCAQDFAHVRTVLRQGNDPECVP